MVFTVTYRNKNGLKVQEVFEAESRAKLFDKLKTQRINAVRIDIGEPKVTHSSGFNLSYKLLKLFAVVLIVVICGIIAFIFLPTEEKEILPKKDITVVKNKPLIVTSTFPKPIITNSVKEVSETKVEAGYYEGRKIISATTNATGYATIITIGEDGRKKRHVVSPPPIFERATDEVIMVALMTPENQEIPPLPDLGGKRADDEFRDSLKTPITILPTDSEKVRAYKEAVKLARREILERLNAGEHFADIIQDHCTLKTENGALRLEAITELRKIEKNYGTEEAIKYRDQMNQAFGKMGISPIELSKQSINNQQEQQ